MEDLKCIFHFNHIVDSKSQDPCSSVWTRIRKHLNKSKNIFLHIFAINWICCQFLQHYAAAASEGAGPRRNFWTSPRMQTSFWNSQTANFFSPIFKEFNKPFNLTFFVCLLFLERENSFWAKLPLKIEIFLYCNKIFPLKGVFEDRQIPIENQEMRGLFFETPLPF